MTTCLHCGILHRGHDMERTDPSALEKSSFQVMIAPPAPTLSPLGAGAHCGADLFSVDGLFIESRVG